MEAKVPKDVEENMEEDMEQPPDWLPDGWIMELKRGEDGTLYQCFISPISGNKFTMKAEVLNYLFTEMDEHWIQAKEKAANSSMLPKTHNWLPKGWLLEIRVGGENIDKMFKFYVHPRMGVRLFSKEDVLLYVKEMKITDCDTDGQCDTNSQDNILALVELNPSALPQGWVKEIVYRKTKEGIRKDPYFVDPVSQYVFRTRKDALRFLETGKATIHQFIPKTSVHDLYSFEKSADLYELLHKRLTKNRKDAKTPISLSKPRVSARREKVNCNGRTSYCTEETDSDISTDSVSTNKLIQNIKNKIIENERGESSSSKTIKRRRRKTTQSGERKLMEHKEGYHQKRN